MHLCSTKYIYATPSPHANSYNAHSVSIVQVYTQLANQLLCIHDMHISAISRPETHTYTTPHPPHACVHYT